VATVLNNLAQLLKAANRLAEAEPLMRRALAIFETSYGPDHPSTCTVRDNLAGLGQPSVDAAPPPSQGKEKGGFFRALLAKMLNPLHERRGR
jgi:hypothetical protein